MLAGAANLATGGGELFRKLTIFLVSAVPVMVLLGLVRAIALLRRGTGASWRDALGAFFIWQSTSVVVARVGAGPVRREGRLRRRPIAQLPWHERPVGRATLPRAALPCTFTLSNVIRPGPVPAASYPRATRSRQTSKRGANIARKRPSPGHPK
jgi:hypothetical protein